MATEEREEDRVPRLDRRTVHCQERSTKTSIVKPKSKISRHEKQ